MTPITKDNRISVIITDRNDTDVLAHITGIGSVPSFLASREAGDTNVLPGEKSVGFDEKSESDIASNPEFLSGYMDPAEVLKDRAARIQFLKFLPQLRLLGAKVEDTLNAVGNDIMYANLAYYNSTTEAGLAGAQRREGEPRRSRHAPPRPPSRKNSATGCAITHCEGISGPRERKPCPPRGLFDAPDGQ